MRFRIFSRLNLSIPSTCILTVNRDVVPADDDFASEAAKAGEKGWKVLYLEADHNPQWSAPEGLAEMLMKIGRR